MEIPIRIQLTETGQVATVDGAALRASWEQTLPVTATIPDAPQLSDGALTAWWQELLQRPPTAQDTAARQVIQLPAPLSGTAERQWTGNSYEISDIAEAPISLQLYQRPTQVSLTVKNLRGSGTTTLSKLGVIDVRNGTFPTRSAARR